MRWANKTTIVGDEAGLLKLLKSEESVNYKKNIVPNAINISKLPLSKLMLDDNPINVRQNC